METAKSRPARSKRGQVAIILSLILVPLIALIGLGADLGLLYFHWVILQKAADAAVLAGAGYLPSQPSTAQSTASSYATANGMKGTEITSDTVAGDDMSITMTTSRTVPYYFLQLVGLSSGTVRPMAKAGIQSNTYGARGLIPIGLPCSSTSCSYSTGTLYQLVQAGANGNGGSWNVGPGNWGRLALGSSGGSQFLNNLLNGYEGSIGSSVNVETGQVNGPTNEGVSQRIAAGTAVNPDVTLPPTYSTVPLYDERLVAVPLVDFTGVTGSSASAPVTGYALMWLVSYTSQGSQKTLNAYYLKTIPLSAVPSTTTTFGAGHPILMQ
jgi:Putative Flp pilus-assembly TadE/G-like